MGITIADPGFGMRNVKLINGSYSKDDRGLRASTSLISRGDNQDPLNADNVDIHQMDVDGDGTIETLVKYIATGGGSGFITAYVVLDEKLQEKYTLTASPDMKVHRGGFTIDKVEGQDLFLTWIGFAENGPLCCGSLNGTGVYRVSGDKLTPVDGPHFTTRES